jgi:hypothetical protein
LFRLYGQAHLYLDGVRALLDNHVATIMEATGLERHIRVLHDDELIYEKTYPRKPETDGNPFWPSDAEDEDFLLWVHNIVSSPERQSILHEVWDR